jgi:BASS family bile acid:Na+ symporter
VDSVYTILIVLSGAATFAALFGGALRLGPEALLRVTEHSRLFVRMLVVIWIAIPLFTALVIFGLGVVGTSATILLLMSVCPGLPNLLTWARIARSSITTAFVALLVTAATEPFMIPYWSRFLSRFLPMDFTVRPAHVLSVLVPTVFLPIVLGFVVRKLSSRATAVLAPVSDFIDLAGTVATIAVVLFQGSPRLLYVPPSTFVALLIITFGYAAFGFWAARPNLDEQKAIAAAAALGNPALALVIVEVSYLEFEAVRLVSVYIVLRAIAMLPLVGGLWYLKRTGRE